MELKYVKEGRVLMVEDADGNREVLDSGLKTSFLEGRRIKSDKELKDEQIRTI